MKNVLFNYKGMKKVWWRVADTDSEALFKHTVITVQWLIQCTAYADETATVARNWNSLEKMYGALGPLKDSTLQ